MLAPTFSFLVPTHKENRPLKRCLDSLDYQLGAQDEVIVIGDTYDGPLPGVEALVTAYGPRYRYLDHNAGRHSYGHDQLNFGIENARGDWLHWNDDDDTWAMGAVPTIRAAAAAAAGRPLLFRFRSYHNGIVFWQQRGLFAQDHVGGHCLVAPNIPDKLGVWSQRYQGDWDFIESTVALHGGPDSIIWRDEIIAIARPSTPSLFSPSTSGGIFPSAGLA